MASHTMGVINMKPSFAKVAAMAPPPISRVIPNNQQPDLAPKTLSNPEKPLQITREALAEPVAAMGVSPIATTGRADKAQSVIQGIEKLALANAQSSKEQALILQGHSGVRGGTDSAEDDQSHLSSSSTKGPGFDTKSMASATTFAMDEKESLRPDDSASVQAGDEEDHNSPHGSAVTSSQYNSDVGAAPVRVQLRDGYGGINIATRRPPVGPMQNPPRFGDFPLPSSTDPSQLPADAQQPDPAEIARPPPPDDRSLSIAPDEKLLDAMGTPKDRLLLLQLEEMIVAFITQSQDDFLDLPPQNSFGRLLAHKLADYYSLAHYNLSHYTNTDSSSVRLFRGVCSNLPASLSMISSAISANGAQSSNAAAFKIMRRGGLGPGPGKASAGASTAPSSSVPSKTTSEAGADTTSDEGVASPVEATPSKDKSKLTREEKEAQYKAARERIFGDLPVTSESTSAGEASASMSRSSSSSGKRKAHRQRTPKDDSFEARSQFVPGYGGMTYSATPSQYQPTFGNAPYPSPYGSSAGLMPSIGYSTTPTPSLPTYEAQAHFNGQPSFPVGLQYGSNEGWPSAQSPQAGSFYGYGSTPTQSAPIYPQHSMQSPLMSQYAQPLQPSFPQMGQNWTPTQYQGLQQSPIIQNTQAMHWPNFPPPVTAGHTSPYPYGQLPSQAYGANYANPSQHPLPGSFNRSIFNPQTRSFVPANSGGRFNAKPGKSHQHKASSRNSGGLEHAKSIESAHGTTVSSGATVSKPQVESIQKKWGTPAHLPKKPPPSQVPSSFAIEAKPPLPSQQSYPSMPPGVGVPNPMVVSGGVQGFSAGINGGLAAGS